MAFTCPPPPPLFKTPPRIPAPHCSFSFLTVPGVYSRLSPLRNTEINNIPSHPLSFSFNLISSSVGSFNSFNEKGIRSILHACISCRQSRVLQQGPFPTWPLIAHPLFPLQQTAYEMYDRSVVDD